MDAVEVHFESNVTNTICQGYDCNYRYGFNGMEKDDEVKSGKGNSYDYGARFHDSRLGRWLSLEPLINKYPFVSLYSFASNSPISMLDNHGYDIVPAFDNQAYTNRWNARIQDLKGKSTLFKSIYDYANNNTDMDCVTDGYAKHMIYVRVMACTDYDPEGAKTEARGFYAKPPKEWTGKYFTEDSRESWKRRAGLDGADFGFIRHDCSDRSSVHAQIRINAQTGFNNSTVFEEVFHAAQNQYHNWTGITSTITSIEREVEAKMAKIMESYIAVKNQNPHASDAQIYSSMLGEGHNTYEVNVLFSQDPTTGAISANKKAVGYYEGTETSADAANSFHQVGEQLQHNIINANPSYKAQETFWDSVGYKGSYEFLDSMREHNISRKNNND